MLTSKIDDILDYALLETNTLVLKMVSFDVRELLKDIEKILNLQFDHKMLSFTIFVADDVPDCIVYDYKRIKQILLNLGFNALKHTEKGYVSIIVSCDDSQLKLSKKFSKTKPKELKKVILRFAVSDSGCGIEKKRRIHLFELFNNCKLPYYNIESDKDIIESSELMGIGLTYSQKMLKKMGSKLELSSVVNVGSTFSFKISAEGNFEESSESSDQFNASIIE